MKPLPFSFYLTSDQSESGAAGCGKTIGKLLCILQLLAATVGGRGWGWGSGGRGGGVEIENRGSDSSNLQVATVPMRVKKRTKSFGQSVYVVVRFKCPCSRSYN